MKKKLVFGVLVSVFVFLVGAGLTLNWYISSYEDQIIPLLEKKLQKKIDVLGGISVSLFPTPHMVVTGLQVQGGFETSSTPLLKAKSVGIYLDFLSLLKGKVSLENIKVIGAELFLEKGANYSFFPAPLEEKRQVNTAQSLIPQQNLVNLQSLTFIDSLVNYKNESQIRPIQVSLLHVTFFEYNFLPKSAQIKTSYEAFGLESTLNFSQTQEFNAKMTLFKLEDRKSFDLAEGFLSGKFDNNAKTVIATFSPLSFKVPTDIVLADKVLTKGTVLECQGDITLTPQKAIFSAVKGTILDFSYEKKGVIDFETKTLQNQAKIYGKTTKKQRSLLLTTGFEGNFSSPLNGILTLKTKTFKTILRKLGLKPSKKLPSDIAVKTVIDYAPGALNLKNLKIDTKQSHLTGEMSLSFEKNQGLAFNLFFENAPGFYQSLPKDITALKGTIYTKDDLYSLDQEVSFKKGRLLLKGDIQSTHRLLNASLDITLENYQTPTGHALGLKTTLKGDKERLTFTKVQGSLNNQNFQGDLAISLNKAKAYLEADFQLDTLDLQEPPEKVTDTTKTLLTNQQIPLILIKNAPTTKAPWSKDPIDFSLLNFFDGIIKIQANSIKLPSYTFDKTSCTFLLKDDVLSTSDFISTFGEGKILASMSVSSNAKATLKLAATNLKIQDVVKKSKKLTKGRFNLSLETLSQGHSIHELIQNLEGPFELSLKEASFKGPDFKSLSTQVSQIKSISDLNNIMASFKKETDNEIQEAKALGAFKKGIGTVSSITVKSPYVSVAGAGTVNLVNWTLALDLKGTLLSKQTVPALPIKVTGPLDEPSVQVDSSALQHLVVSGSVKGLLNSLQNGLSPKGKSPENNQDGQENTSNKDIVTGVLKGLFK